MSLAYTLLGILAELIGWIVAVAGSVLLLWLIHAK
jgi:hypothetical protein